MPSLLREPRFAAVDKQQQWNWLHEVSGACSDSGHVLAVVLLLS